MSERIAIPQAHRRLSQLLQHAGVSVDNPFPSAVLGAFRSFVEEPAECTSEMLLFQWGTYTFSGEHETIVSLVRQFCTERPGVLDPDLWQVHCDLKREPTDAFSEILGSHFWSDEFVYGQSDRNAWMTLFFDDVLTSEAFRVAVTLIGWRLEVWGEDPC